MADFVVRQILKGAGGDWATKKLAQRKLKYRCHHQPLRVADPPQSDQKATLSPGANGVPRGDQGAHQGQQGQGNWRSPRRTAIAIRFFGTMPKEFNPKPVLVAAVEGPLPRSLASSLRLGRLLQRMSHCPRSRTARIAAVARRRRRKTRTATSRGGYWVLICSTCALRGGGGKQGSQELRDQGPLYL